MFKEEISRHAVTILSLTLFIVIYLLRLQQGGWDIKLDLFPQMRQMLDQRIAQLLPTPQAELLSGILLGNKKDLPYYLKLALRDSSTLHIVVVSGQNLTMLSMLLLSLSGLIKRRNAIVLSLAAIALYTLITGAQIPVLRAATMAILSSLAQIFGRQRDGVWVLILTAGTMLLIDPFWIKDISFQLSFLATFGVIVVAPVLKRYLYLLPQFLSQDLAITTGAQLMVMPIIIQNFHQLSLVGIITNLLVVWTVPIIMILGGIMLAVSFIWSGLAWIIGLVASALLTYFIYIVQFFASLPFAWEYVGEQVWIVWVGYYLVLAGILLAFNRR